MPERERKEHAVSELIGAILLVGLVITAMAIVAVLLLSNPPPEEVPQLNILASRNETSKQFFLYHNGGDAMKIENTIIRINNNPTRVLDQDINIT
ncbi:MAG: type IV pilin N-terminal domain-containing protein, partial [Methanolinea sp.]